MSINFQTNGNKELPPLRENGQLRKRKTERDLSNSGVKRIQNRSQDRSFSLYSPQKLQNKSQVSDNSHPLITQIQNETDPFYMGATRHDKFRYEGSPDDRIDKKLYKFYTIARANRVRKDQELEFSKKILGNYDIRSNFKKNKIIEDIMRESDIVIRREDMANSIMKLKEMKLLEQDYQIKKYIPSNRNQISYVYNDYHARSTNPGYARNGLGTFYTK